MLIWHKELWLIDHGASLYFHHSWTNWEKHAQSPFALIKDVLLPQASMLQEADALFKTILTPETLQSSLTLFLWNGWTGKIRTKVLMQFEKSIFSFYAPASFSNFH
jgi:polyphosphate kinase